MTIGRKTGKGVRNVLMRSFSQLRNEGNGGHNEMLTRRYFIERKDRKQVATREVHPDDKILSHFNPLTWRNLCVRGAVAVSF